MYAFVPKVVDTIIVETRKTSPQKYIYSFRRLKHSRRCICYNQNKRMLSNVASTQKLYQKELTNTKIQL